MSKIIIVYKKINYIKKKYSCIEKIKKKLMQMKKLKKENKDVF